MLTHFLVALMLSAPSPTVPQVQIITALQQRVKDQQEQITNLQLQIKAYQKKLYDVETQNNQLKFDMYGPDERIVDPIDADSKPSCPVDGFILQWFEVEKSSQYSLSTDYLEGSQYSDSSVTEQTTHIEQPKSYEFKQFCVKKAQ